MQEEFRDFRNFLWRVWSFLALPDPTPVQYDIAEWMQHGPRRQITEAFRGVGKSWIAAAFVCWNLYLNPQLKFLIVSASKDRADAFSIFVKRLILEMPELRFLMPRDDQRTSNIAFDVGPASNDQSPSVKSVGITGQITGSRADIIIPDDVESLNNSATTEQRRKLGERIKEFDAVLKPGGRVIYLGTPQTEHSIYLELETERNYEARIWPAKVPFKADLIKYGSRLAPCILAQMETRTPGTSTDPLRFSDLDLAERAGSYGRAGFALQFMLDTSLSDADRYVLKLKDLTFMNLNPDMAPGKVIWAASPERIAKDIHNVGLRGDAIYRPMEVLGPWGEYTGAVMFIDPSGKGKDETAYAVVKTRNGQLYLTASGGFQDGYSESTLLSLSEIARDQKVNEICIEENFGNGMFSALMKAVLMRVYPCTVTDVHSKGQKELRVVDTLEPILKSHRLIVDEAVIRGDTGGVDEDGAFKVSLEKSLFWQLTRITKDRGSLKHDDRVEALAGAVAYWVEAMGRDVDHALEAVNEEAKRLALEEFMTQVVLGGDYGDMNDPLSGYEIGSFTQFGGSK